MWNSENHPAAKGSLWPWLTFCLGLLFLGALVWHFGPAQIFASFGQMNATWLWPCTLLLVATTLLGAANVYFLIDHAKRPKFSKFLPVYWISWGVGLVVPGQIGDVAALSLAFRRHGMNPSFTLGRTLLDKLVTLLVMAVIAAVAVASLAERVRWNYGRYAWPTLIFLALCCFLLWRHADFIARFFSPLKPGPAGGIGRTAKEFLIAVKSMPERIALNAIISLIKIGLTGGAYWAMFAALGYDGQPIWEIVSLATLAGLVAYLPVSFNGYGTVEATGLVLFGSLGIPAATVLAAYLGMRLLVLTLAWLPSSLFLLSMRQATSA